MDLLQLKYFKDAAKYENFSEAAKQNYVPQPSISKAVKSLEEEFGVPLFDRKGKKIFLNDNGRFLYEKSVEIFDIIDICTDNFSRYKSDIIKIYIQEGSFFIPKLVADFTFRNNNTTINYTTVEDVLKSKTIPFDFTFMPMQKDMSTYDYISLSKDDMVLLVSTNHKLAGKNKIDIGDVRDEKFISYYNTISHRVLTDRLCNQIGGFAPNYTVETHDEYIVLHLVSKNQGVTLIPKNFYLSRPYDNIHIIELSETIQCELVIAWEKGKPLSKIEKTFLEFTKSWFNK